MCSMKIKWGHRINKKDIIPKVFKILYENLEISSIDKMEFVLKLACSE